MKETYYRANGKEFKTLNLCVNNGRKEKRSINETFSTFKFIVSLILIVCVVIFLIWTFLQGKWNFKIKYEENIVKHYVFTLSTGFLSGMYISVLFANKGLQNKKIKILVIVFIIYLSILNLTSLGIYFYVDLPFLIQKEFQSNSELGILFFTRNLPLWTIIFASSFLLESD